MTTEAAGASPVDRGVGRLEPERERTCEQGCNGCDDCTEYEEYASRQTEVWGIAVIAPKQRLAAKKHCFGDCGKISMAGAINDEVTGGLFVCCQQTCPYEAKVIPNYGETMSFGRPHTVHLRLLNPLEE